MTDLQSITPKGKYKNIAGVKFSRLLALYPSGRTRNNTYVWACKCDCGNITNVFSGNLIRGTTKSCGCLRNEMSANRCKIDKKIHGFSGKVREGKR